MDFSQEVQINTLQHDNEPEVDDLVNHNDELKKKIVALAGTIRKWNEETVNVRQTVRMQLADILDFGLNKRKMQKTELRDLVTEIFQFHGISDSWLRKLLPVELKDSSKTRISYLQRHEMEKERQRLKQIPMTDTYRQCLNLGKLYYYLRRKGESRGRVQP